MSEKVYFRWVEIEGFRGFEAPQRIDLDASVVLISGPNGTGKTSFFDALQWLLLGTIQRLEAWRPRRNTEHVVNRYYDQAGRTATVAAGVTLPDGVSVELRRSGTHRATEFEWRAGTGTLFGLEAAAALERAFSPHGRLPLRQALLTAGLLQQDGIRDVLHETAANRYERLAHLLGLTDIARFPDATKRRAQLKAREADEARAALKAASVVVQSHQRELTSVQRTAASVAEPMDERARVLDELALFAADVRLASPLPAGASEAAAVRAAVAEVGAELARVEADYNPPPASLDVDFEAARLDLTQEVDRAEDVFKSAAAAARESSLALDAERDRSSREQQLAADALPLVTESCPVCGQVVEPESVRARLNLLLGSESPALISLSRTAEAARIKFVESDEARAEAARRLAELSIRKSDFDAGQAAHGVWLEAARLAVEHAATCVVLVKSEAIQAGILSALSESVRALRHVWRVLGPVAQPPRAELSPAVIQADARLARSSANEEGLRAIANAAADTETAAKALQKAAVRAVAEVGRQRFASLAPVLQEIYARLDPHPAFTDLSFSVDVYREKGNVTTTVFDRARDVEADPLVVFSSAQGNVVALSAFLALSWSSGEDALPFVWLDDPLQSMDDVNVLGFADLCRHIRGERQLFISTHDPRLSNLLARKLAPRRADQRTLLARFVAWSRSGPVIDQTEVTPQPIEGARRAAVPVS